MSPEATLDYALPGLARIRIRVPGAGRLRRALIDSKFAALTAPLPAGQAPDIEMHIGPFTLAPPAESRVIDKDFWIARNTLSYRGERGRGATEISGLDGGPVCLRHAPYGESLVGSLSRGLRGVNLYLEPMLGWWLRQRGVHLLHAGAVAVGDGAVLVCGTNGAGKTRLILEWCLRHGAAFLGDDLILLSEDGTVSPLPEHAQVLGLRAAALAAGRVPTAGRLALLWRLWSGMPAVMPPGLRFGGPLPLRGLILAEATPGAAESYRLLAADAGAVWRSAWRLEQLELVKNQRRHRQLCNMSRLVLAYEYAFPGSPIFAAMLGCTPTPPPAGLAGLPAWRLELGRSWSPATAAAVAATFGEAPRE